MNNLITKNKYIQLLSFINVNNTQSSSLSAFVPKASFVKQDDLEKLNEFVLNTKNLLVLSGAGLSTESGIPDYRSPEVGLYSRSKNRPINHSEFVKSFERRKMYWARNYVSWPMFSSFKPNKSHSILAEWEKKKKIHHQVTQNVDSLLTKAGCLKVTELHGSSYQVKCLECHFRLSRESMQHLISALNKDWNYTSNELNPDNDILLDQKAVDSFVLPCCPNCKKHMLKPEVVFFGDSIPKKTVDLVNQKLEKSDGLLALGTSLQVYSAYRIILKAKELNIPIAIINVGETRGDKYANIKIDSICSQVLSKIEF